MIRFACPSCRTVYEVPENVAGKKTTCRSCGQRVRVPPLPNKTVVRTPIPPPPVPAIKLTPIPPPESGKPWTLFILCACALITTGAIVSALAYGVLRQQAATPVAAREGAEAPPATERSKATAAKREPKAPPSRPEKPINRLAMEVKAPATRLAAARELAKMGREGKPAVHALCEAIASTTGDERAELLEALEKITPEVHRCVVTLLVDQQETNNLQALKSLQNMGEDGAGALPVLYSYGNQLSVPPAPRKRYSVRDNSQRVILQHLETIRALGLTRPESLKHFTRLALPESSQGYMFDPWTIQTVSRKAIESLIEAARSKPALEKEVVETLGKALVHPWISKQPAIEGLGKLGAAARPAIPELKKLKLSEDASIRLAASDAVKKIEAAAP